MRLLTGTGLREEQNLGPASTSHSEPCSIPVLMHASLGMFSSRGEACLTHLCILAPTTDADCFVDMYYMKEHRNNTSGLIFSQDVHRRGRGT